MTDRLSEQGYEQARIYLLEQARPLERALYRHGIGAIGIPGASGPDSLQLVARTLGEFRCEGGGFGRALEPDCRFAGPSVLATWTALGILRDLDVRLDDGSPLASLLRDALSYVGAQRQGDVWPLLPPAAEVAPHAPWWDQQPPGQLARTFEGFTINPTADLVSMAWRWPGWLDPVDRERITESAVARVESGPAAGAVNEWICAAALATEAAVPRPLRDRLVATLTTRLPEVVQRTPADFRGYGLSPLDVAPTPQSPFAEVLAEPLETALAALVAAQQPDGSWAPTWSWMGREPAQWARARTEWCGVLTLSAVRRLHTYRRITHPRFPEQGHSTTGR
ncbi:hypothetical protein MM440_16535 [Arsenicicoccus piscis]|uniref:hypothetical protein n=1 Tax=Arsenicicoccus piscis TaxID=673954 RepID=UPI001F4CDFF4|nr:hypothetical protein [Arsenicicoccus piscis]MCH8629333.1 hypothetical protein [Arsenicicoccus piscis]